MNDALSHAQFLSQQCRDAANNLQDPNLKDKVQRIAAQHCGVYSQFYDLL